MIKNIYKINRNNLLDKIKDNSMVILFAGKAIQKTGDQNYPFTPNRNFYYLTGIKEAIVTAFPKTEHSGRRRRRLLRLVPARIPIRRLHRDDGPRLRLLHHPRRRPQRSARGLRAQHRRPPPRPRSARPRPRSLQLPQITHRFILHYDRMLRTLATSCTIYLFKFRKLATAKP